MWSDTKVVFLIPACVSSRLATTTKNTCLFEVRERERKKRMTEPQIVLYYSKIHET